MATKFTEKEVAEISSKLKAAAREYASSVGMRKTTVDELCARAGISKGAFYNFYDSKEALFFEILEDWHTHIYAEVQKILNDTECISDKERVYKALIYACRSLEENSMIGFYENDVPLLMRKMPQEILDSHYHSDEKHITDLITSAGIAVNAPHELVAATVRGIMLMLTHRGSIGELYPQVLELLIRSVSDHMVI